MVLSQKYHANFFNASHGPNMTIMFFFKKDFFSRSRHKNYTLKNYKSSSRYVKFALL